VEEFLRNWGTPGIFVGILLTGLGFPMPEELPVVLGGALVAGKHAYWWVMLPTCIVGVIIGDSFLYFIGRLWGSRLVQSPFISKHILTPDRLRKITDNFHDYGIRILLFARLTPGIRAPIFLTAGITKLPLFRFILADGIYAIPGVSILFGLGYAFTDQVVELIQNEAGKVKSIIILVVLVGIAGYMAYRFLRKPVVTGSPLEMPKIVGQMTDSLEFTIKNLLPSHHERAPENPVPPQHGEPGERAGTRPQEDRVAHESKFDKGDKVKVKDGTFAGMDGEVKEVLEAKGALLVELNVFGRPVALEVACSQVDRA
jgi:membrane protein DedA with SNARE-associated domain